MAKHIGIAAHWYEGPIECVATYTDMGHMCGYCRVPPEHPWFGKSETDEVSTVRAEDVLVENAEEAMDHYGVIPTFIAMMGGSDGVAEWQRQLGGQVRVHGGITWTAAYCPALVTEREHQRKTNRQRASRWWIGFDCGHAGDRPDPEHMSEEHLSFQRKFRMRHPDLAHDDGKIWKLADVRRELKGLAAQIDAVPRPRLLSRYGPAQRELRRLERMGA